MYIFINTIYIFLVPVELWTSTTLPPPLSPDTAALLGIPTPDINAAIASLPMSTNPGGCDIDGEFYMDGMKVRLKILLLSLVRCVTFLTWSVSRSVCQSVGLLS